MAEICFNRDTFYTYIVIGLGIISFVIYRLYLDKKEELLRPLSSQESKPVNITETIADTLRGVLSASSVQHHEDLNRMVNPMVPPLKRGSFSYSGMMPEFPINIPTRGEYGSFQQFGYIYNDANADQAMPLMGRRIHSNQYEYYTFHHNNPNLKIPITVTGNKELDNDASMSIPLYPGQNFTIKLYDNDSPRYIPY